MKIEIVPMQNDITLYKHGEQIIAFSVHQSGDECLYLHEDSDIDCGVMTHEAVEEKIANDCNKRFVSCDTLTHRNFIAHRKTHKSLKSL